MRYTTKYKQFRAAGYQAHVAFHAAKAMLEWESLEYQDKVRLRAEPEEESYFGCCGEPEGYTDQHGRKVTAEQERKEICATIDRDGCWWIVSEYLDESSGVWEHADSIGMCIYSNPLSPFENCYVPDLMRSAIDAYNGQAIAAAI